MEPPRVYIVCWRDRTFAEIGSVFRNLEDAEAYQNRLRAEYCPSGHDRDGSLIIERYLE